MRVGFDVSQTCGPRAGCAWHADALAKALASILEPGDLVLYHHFGNWINHDTKHGTSISGCDSPLDSHDYDEAKELWAQIEAGTQSIPGKPSVVHSNSFMAPHIRDAPLVYTIHDLSFLTCPQYTTEANKRFCEAEFSKALKHASAFHFISDSTLGEFNLLFPNYLEETRKPFRVVHSAPRLGARPSNVSTKEQEAPWLFVGTVEPRKNIEGLLAAFETYLQVSPNPRPLVLAGGKGWHSEALHQRFHELEKQGMFKYLGPVPDDRLSRLYEESFAFLFPSHYEGFGLPVIEAMNHSLPVISNDINSIKEFANEIATFVHFADTDSVVAKMIALESNFEFYRSQSSKSRIAAGKYNWSTTASKLIPLYEDAIEQRDRNTAEEDTRYSNLQG